ncbi:MAG: hypothetical protein QM767_10815 [Anaeromyxobacter sp.]
MACSSCPASSGEVSGPVITSVSVLAEVSEWPKPGSREWKTTSSGPSTLSRHSTGVLHW